MSGVCGGVLCPSSLRETLSRLDDQDANETWRYETGEHGMGVSSPPVDPASSKTWMDGERAAIVYGTITNLGELEVDDDTLFERLLSDPVETARILEGEFLITCCDGSSDRFLVVTDKLGARSCFYTGSGRFVFSTSVGALMPLLDDRSVDLQGISDMLLMGHLWGERTLVEGVSAVRAATVLEVIDGERTSRRYWKPDYTPHRASEEYLDELADRYHRAAGRLARTLPEETGIWLSGGLDSRTTAAALLRNTPASSVGRMTAYGYDANPPTNDNPRLASRTAHELGIEYNQVPLTPETFAEDFEHVIDVTDGMMQWNTLVNLSPSYRVDEDVSVLMEGAQGELIGDHILRYHLDDSRSVVDSQFASEAAASVDIVTRLLDADVDPLATFRKEAERSPEGTHRGAVLDIHLQNYYARAGLESNRIMRDRKGSRSMQVDGDYLEWCARIPRYFRKGTFPLSERVFKSDAGGVPYGTSIAKLGLCRRVCPDLAEIPYERTKLKPSRPYHLHVAGFVGNVLMGRLQSKATYASGSLADFWIRDRETEVHHRVAELVDDAVGRDLFDGDSVRRIYNEHMDGENNAGLLGRVTTLEYWLQQNMH